MTMITIETLPEPKPSRFSKSLFIALNNPEKLYLFNDPHYEICIDKRHEYPDVPQAVKKIWLDTDKPDIDISLYRRHMYRKSEQKNQFEAPPSFMLTSGNTLVFRRFPKH